jgi:hypothetical protein
MGEVLPLPHRGETFLDPRGEGRSIRVSGHRGAATIVLSIWQHGECRATFRLGGSEVDGFVRALLAAAPPPAPELLDPLHAVVAELPTQDVVVEEEQESSSADPTEPVVTEGPAATGDDPTTGAIEDPGIGSTG